jgi:hypothetical protein
LNLDPLSRQRPFSQKLPTRWPRRRGIIVASLIATAIGFGIASTHRAIAWSVLLLSLVVGIFLAFGGCHAAFVENSFSDAIWSELGWPWVIASIVGPMLPVVAVSRPDAPSAVLADEINARPS